MYSYVGSLQILGGRGGGGWGCDYFILIPNGKTTATCILLLGQGGGPEKGHIVCRWRNVSLSTLSTDAAGQLDVLGHDRHTLGVDRAQVRVLEQTHQVSLARLLQGHHGR